MSWKEKSDKAKRLHRTDIKDWTVGGLYETFPPWAKSILDREDHDYESFLPFAKHPPKKTSIPSLLDAKHVSPKKFQDDYEAKSIPCVIQSIPQGYDAIGSDNDHDDNLQKYQWNATHNWTLEALNQDDDIRERPLKCGEDDDGNTIRIKLKHFLKYMKYNRDDSPLYIFDATFDEDKYASRLLKDFRVPTYFDEDLFHLVGERRRPPYRWFLIGPERSGTTVHIDPLATSAWNTLIIGKKRWVLFPPHVPKHVVKGKGLVYKGEDDEAIHYFMTILPRIKKQAMKSAGIGDYKDFECYEFTQHEGETVYIPNGWWHAVLNLTDTVGITQNFCSQRNFDQVWLKTRSGRKKMAYKWLCKLKKSYPSLHKRAKELNKEDNYVMKYDPREISRREKEEGRMKSRARKADKKAEKRRKKEEADDRQNRQTGQGKIEESCRSEKRSRFEGRVVSPERTNTGV